jgi:outer membrane protein assembly factor BamB
MRPLTPQDPRRVGEFALRARLGAGGMGHVYLGHSPAGRAVALKVCHPDLAADPAFVARFAREVAAARAVNGLFTAPVIAAGPDDDPPWLATAYVPGPSLLDTVRTDGPLPEAAVWRLAAGLAEALLAIHDRGLVHRDLKPTNILLAADGPRVIDFGIARALDGVGLTTAGVTLGAPSYMSPEQARGLRAGPASDVFSLGSVLVFATCGNVPFGDGDPPAVLHRVVHAPPVLDGVPEPLRGLVAACLAKNPDDRPAPPWLLRACQAVAPRNDGTTTSFWPPEVAALITRYEGGSDQAVPPGETPPGTLPRGIGRRRALAGAAGVCVAGLAAVGWGIDRRLTAHPRPAALWSYQTGGPVSSGAVISGDTVYIGSGDHNVYALDTADGRARTVLRTSGAVSGALALAGDLLVAGSADGTIYARSITAGTSWTHPTGGPVLSAPAVGSGAVYIGSDDHFVYALDARTGRRLWRAGTGGPVRSRPLAGTPALKDLIWSGSDDGYLYCLSASDGQVNWRLAAQGAVNSGLVTDANGNICFGTDDGYLFYDMAFGPHEWWRSALGGAVLGTPAAAGGTIYAGSGRSGVYALDSGTGQPIWTCRTGGPVNSGLGVSGAALYAGSDDGYLYAIDTATGRVAWRFETGGPVRSRILVAGGVVYFGSLDHRVYAVRAMLS